jgi:hypothetical protein
VLPNSFVQDVVDVFEGLLEHGEAGLSGLVAGEVEVPWAILIERFNWFVLIFLKNINT